MTNRSNELKGGWSIELIDISIELGKDYKQWIVRWRYVFISNQKAITAGDGIDNAIDASGGNKIVVVIIQRKLNCKDNNMYYSKCLTLCIVALCIVCKCKCKCKQHSCRSDDRSMAPCRRDPRCARIDMTIHFELIS